MIFRSPASEKENVRLPNSPDFENLPDLRMGRDLRLSPKKPTVRNDRLINRAVKPGYFTGMAKKYLI